MRPVPEQTVLVTGAPSGLGKRLAGEGASRRLSQLGGQLPADDAILTP